MQLVDKHQQTEGKEERALRVHSQEKKSKQAPSLEGGACFVRVEQLAAAQRRHEVGGLRQVERVAEARIHEAPGLQAPGRRWRPPARTLGPPRLRVDLAALAVVPGVEKGLALQLRYST